MTTWFWGILMEMRVIWEGWGLCDPPAGKQLCDVMALLTWHLGLSRKMSYCLAFHLTTHLLSNRHTELLLKSLFYHTCCTCVCSEGRTALPGSTQSTPCFLEPFLDFCPYFMKALKSLPEVIFLLCHPLTLYCDCLYLFWNCHHLRSGNCGQLSVLIASCLVPNVN